MEKAKKEFPTIRFEISDPATIVKEAQLIITTTTSTDPVIPYDGQVDLTGKHFAGSGAFKSFMQEIPDSIIKEVDHLYVDTHAAFSECGEMINARTFGHSEETVPELKSLVQDGENEEMKTKRNAFQVGRRIYF